LAGNARLKTLKLKSTERRAKDKTTAQKLLLHTRENEARSPLEMESITV
jgi:hypothetical protein